jgi:membrane-associated protease RseP (regulator of RpoE activity)
MPIDVFLIFDILLLAAIIIFLSIYLYKRRERLNVEGPLILYKTGWGLKLIDRIGGKYKKTLWILSYISIFVAYILMIGILWIVGRGAWEYLTNPVFTQFANVPPVAPLIPYFPSLFGLSDVIPQLYTIYFVVAILITMFVHEFSHGIFARRHDVGIKSTGFAFLKYFPAITGAFVEQDDRDILKKSKFAQMSILSAGVFANLIIAIIFGFILIFVFSVTFVPAGVIVDSTIEMQFDVSEIHSIENYNLIGLTNQEKLDLIEKEGIQNEIVGNYNLTSVVINGGSYYTQIDNIKSGLENGGNILVVLDTPALRNGLEGAISKIDGIPVRTNEEVINILKGKSPGGVVDIESISLNGIKEYKITLEQNQIDTERAWLGIQLHQITKNPLLIESFHFLSASRKQQLYIKGITFYQPIYPGASEFIYYLIWWIVSINALVALFNILPLGILDGGRFFELTVERLTGSRKVAKALFKSITYFILFLLVLMIVKWIFLIF